MLKLKALLFGVIQIAQYYLFFTYFKEIYETTILWPDKALNLVGYELDRGAGLGIGLMWITILGLISLGISLIIFTKIFKVDWRT